MTTIRDQLSDFICAGRPGRLNLCLPQFEGNTREPLRVASDKEFGYPSSAFASRDLRSALYIRDVLTSGYPPESVSITGSEDFLRQSNRDNAAVTFIFGSRSNTALSALPQAYAFQDLVHFEFNREWAIVGQDGVRFTIPDPSQLSREEYESRSDYGVVARINARSNPTFLIAGLGSRATEGCGRYFSEQWRELYKRFPREDFALVLEFPAPVDPSHCHEVASYDA